MRNKKTMPLMLFWGLLMFLCGCTNELSSNSSEDSSRGVTSVDISAAQVRLAQCSRSVEHSWEVDGDTLIIKIDDSFSDNGFAVEADVIIESHEGYITLAAAGVDGDADGWALRVENGIPFFVWRDASTDGEWLKLESQEPLKLNQLETVRAERVDSLVVLYVDGQICAAGLATGSIRSLEGSFTIGFDPTEVTENTPGRVMCVRFEKVHNMKILERETEMAPQKSMGEDLDSSQTEWIAAWEFNDPSNIGRDYTGHGFDAVVGEGTVSNDEGVAYFDGVSGLMVPFSDKLLMNEFVIETRIKLDNFGSMKNIIVAEPPGRGVDGWMLRVDEETLRLHLRDAEQDGDDWQIFAGKDLVLGQWMKIRVERSSDSIRIFQNGELTVVAAYSGDVTQQRYDWAIGYDAMNQQYHERYFEGNVDYIRYGSFTGFGKGALTKTDDSKGQLLVAWEFNDSAFVGLDKMSNNSVKYPEGKAVIVDKALKLDGKSGLPVMLSSTFCRRNFAVETKVKPSAFGKIQNVLVAEPPGRYGDGWMIRIDDGVLRVHLRDENTDGTDWKIFTGKALKLNEWTDIRVELDSEKVRIYQDGKQTLESDYSGDVSQLGYNLGIGYDAMNQQYHDRFFEGSIDYIRYYGL